MSELKPCPFCGGKAKIDDCRTIWRICCTVCDALVLGERAPEPVDDAHAECIDWNYYAQTAIDAWNKRVGE